MGTPTWTERETAPSVELWKRRRCKQIGLNRVEGVREVEAALGHVMTADYLGASDRL